MCPRVYLPSLVLKARHLSGSAFRNFYRLKVSEQALGGIPLGFGIVVEDKPSELSCGRMLAGYNFEEDCQPPNLIPQ